MYRYLGFGTIACVSSMTSLTISNSILIDRIKSEYYLGRDIPGQLISLGVSLLLSYKYKSNLLKLGVVTSSMLPISVCFDLYASKSDYPTPFLITGSILRSISFVGPAGTHTATVVNICKNVNPGILGSRNMIMGSIGATIGISSGIYTSKYHENHREYIAILLSFMYPFSLYLGWIKYM